MAENVFMVFFVSVLDFLKGVALFSIISIFFVLAGSFFQKLLMQKLKLKWVHATMIAVYIICLACVFAIYVYPLFLADLVPSYIPPYLASPVTDQAYMFLLQGVRLLIVSLALTVLLLPVILIGAFLFDWLSKKTRLGFALRLSLSVFIVNAIAWYFILFYLGFIIPGILFMIYFGVPSTP